MSADAVVEVSDLTVVFDTPHGQLCAADQVSLTLEAGKTLCLVGESGCGKSVTALAIIGLLPNTARVVSGSVEFGGRDLLRTKEKELRKLRGNEISMIFQEPMTALNPVFTVGYQVAEVIRTHQRLRRKAAKRKAIQVLEMVGMPAATQRYDAYPHELSGGMRQRVMIAAALACRPTVVIADEPTTALDVTIQAQILDLLANLQQDMGMTTLLITHNLGIVADTAHQVAVMYAGQVVEEAPPRELFNTPRHPYTQALLRSVPRPEAKAGERLHVIAGSVPDLARLPRGCRFAPRCPHVLDRCRKQVPSLTSLGPGRRARCVLVDS